MPTIFGTTGADLLFSNSHYTDTATTQVYGRAGNDTVFGGSGTDYLYGEGGDDYLEDPSGVGGLFGGDNNDILVASIGHGTLDGGADDDVFYFASNSTGFYHVHGGPSAGSDVIVALTNSAKIGLKSISDIDTIDGDGRTNVTILSDSAGVSLDFSATTLIDITAISGSQAADTIVGSASDDSIFGGFYGNDVLNGGAGNDTLSAESGSTLTGGAGADLFVVAGGTLARPLVVSDFDAAAGDLLKLPAGATWVATDTAGGAQVVVSFNTSATRVVTLTGVSADDVDAAWFV